MLSRSLFAFLAAFFAAFRSFAFSSSSRPSPSCSIRFPFDFSLAKLRNHSTLQDWLDRYGRGANSVVAAKRNGKLRNLT
jgi:hypothetical protein